MSASDAFETDILKLIFNNTALSTLAAAGSLTTLTVALHSSDPGEAGNQTTNEITYTSYARVTVTRSSGFTVTGSSVSPAANIDFPACTGGTATATYASIGTGVSNYMICSGPLSSSIAISTGVTPRLNTTSTITVD